MLLRMKLSKLFIFQKELLEDGFSTMLKIRVLLEEKEIVYHTRLRKNISNILFPF